MNEVKEFINECGRPEIQKLWKPRWGDAFYGKCIRRNDDAPGGRGIYNFDPNQEDPWYQTIPVGWDDDETKFTEETDAIWLPSLQQILDGIEKDFDLCIILKGGKKSGWGCHAYNWLSGMRNIKTKGVSPRLALIRAWKEILNEPKTKRQNNDSD